MNSKYEGIFNQLVKSYYNGSFDEYISNIMNSNNESEEEIFKIISSLCGVSVPFDENYIYNLKKAITNYSVNERIIEKLNCNNAECKRGKDGKLNCQRVCPFDAIMYDTEEKDVIINEDLCIKCGKCIDECDSGKILDKVEFLPLMELLNKSNTVIAAVAPAIIGQFGDNVTMEQLRAAFIKLGFKDMIEVAFAADVLSIKEAVEFNKNVKSPNDLLITSCCCPMWVGMLKKVYGELIPNLSPSVSPMIATGRIIKSINKEAKVVFIGPCVAKKAEAKDKDIKGAIDFVLTFQELKEIFNALEINPEEMDEVITKEYAARGGRLYARTGGVSIAVSEVLEELYPEQMKNYKAIQANGVRECKEILNKALSGEANASFIEGMGCIGGCVGGPKAIISKEDGKKQVDKFAYDSPIKVAVHSEELDKVLSKIGINELKDFEDESKINILERYFQI